MINNGTTNLTDTEMVRRNTSIGMGVIGIFSVSSDLIILSVILYFRLYKRIQTRLVAYLCSADLVQGLAALSSLGWIYQTPQIGDPLCTFQANMFQTGNVASAIASCFIGIYVWAHIHVLDYKCLAQPGRKYEICVILGIWGGSILFTVIGWIRYATTGVPFYTPVGFKSWCWVSEKYPTERLMLHYTWILLICVLLFILYIHIIITLNRNKVRPEKSTNSESKDSLVKKMIGFPVVFFFAFVPLGLERVLSIFSSGKIQLPPVYVGVAVCIFVCNGFLNALLYGYTRKLFQKVRITGTKSTASSSSAVTRSRAENPYHKDMDNLNS